MGMVTAGCSTPSPSGARHRPCPGPPKPCQQVPADFRGRSLPWPAGGTVPTRLWCPQILRGTWTARSAWTSGGDMPSRPGWTWNLYSYRFCPSKALPSNTGSSSHCPGPNLPGVPVAGGPRPSLRPEHRRLRCPTCSSTHTPSSSRPVTCLGPAATSKATGSLLREPEAWLFIT